MSLSLKSHSSIFPPAQKLTTQEAKLSRLGNHGQGRLGTDCLMFGEFPQVQPNYGILLSVAKFHCPGFCEMTEKGLVKSFSRPVEVQTVAG